MGRTYSRRNVICKVLYVYIEKIREQRKGKGGSKRAREKLIKAGERERGFRNKKGRMILISRETRGKVISSVWTHCAVIFQLPYFP